MFIFDMILKNVDNFSKLFLNVSTTLFTLLFILIGLFSDNINKASDKESALSRMLDVIKEIIKLVHNPWVNFLKSKKKSARIFIIGCYIFIIFIFILSYISSAKLFNSVFSTAVLFYSLLATCLLTLVLYLSFSFLFYLCSIINTVFFSYINGLKKYINQIVIICLALPILYLGILFLSMNNVSKYFLYVSIIGLTFSHLFIFKGLFLIIEKPEYLSTKTQKSSKYKGIATWLIVLLLNLYSEVIILNGITGGSLLSEDGNKVTKLLELLYFTFVSFITIGFGDIVPNNAAGKIMSIVIFISAVYFMVVFIGTVLSAKISDKDYLYGYVNQKTRSIYGNLQKLLREIKTETDINLLSDNLELQHIKKALIKINPQKNSPLLISYPQTYSSWFNYLLYNRDITLKITQSLYTLIPYLESDFIQILILIEDCSYFKKIDPLANTSIKNGNLEFLAKHFLEYINLVNSLEKYRIANFDEYSSTDGKKL